MCLNGIGIAIYSCEVFQCYAFPQCYNTWAALLNWCTKSSKFEEDFNDNELL